MNKSIYEVCERCKLSRDAGDLSSAKNCRDCKGTGIRRKDDSFICNMCAEVIAPRGYGLIDAKVSGGYESNYLWDLTQYQFSMCEKCLRDLFNSFKAPPSIHGMDIDGTVGDADAYENDREMHEQRELARAARQRDGEKAGKNE